MKGSSVGWDRKYNVRVGIALKRIVTAFFVLLLATPVNSQALDSNLDEDDIRNLIGQLANIEDHQRAIGPLIRLGARALPLLIEELETNKLGARPQVVYFIGRASWEIGDTATKAIIEAIFDEEFAAPEWAAATLGYMNRQLVPSIAATNCRERLFEGNSVRILQELGPRKKDLVEALAGLLEEERQCVKNGAAIALGNIGDEAIKAVPSLIEMLSIKRGGCGSCPDEPDYATYALRKIGYPVVPYLLEGFKHDNPRVRAEICRILEDFCYEPGVVDVLITGLTDEDYGVRRNAADALEWVGPNAKSAIPQLINCLDDENEYVRHAAALALGRMGPEAEVAVPYLLDALENENSHVRNGIVTALARIGPKPGVVPYLVELLEENDLMLWGTVAYTLSKFDSDAEEAVQPLIAMLDSEDEKSIRRVIQLLGNIGPAARASVPRLRTFTFSENYELVIPALYALFAIGDKPQQRLQQLLYLTKTTDIDLKCRIIKLLGKIGPPAKDFIPYIIQLLDDEEPQVRVAAARSLGYFGADAVSTLPKLRELASEDERYVRDWTNEAITRIEIMNAKIIPADDYDVDTLILHLTEDDWAVRCRAAIILSKMGPNARNAVPALIRTLEDGNDQIRHYAAQALGSIGADSRQAIPKLRIMAVLDNSKEVRKAALEAIFIIQELWPEDDL